MVDEVAVEVLLAHYGVIVPACGVRITMSTTSAMLTGYA